MNLKDKMECYAKRPEFITLKDHKENIIYYLKRPQRTLKAKKMSSNEPR